jgi:hypothetical protein
LFFAFFPLGIHRPRALKFTNVVLGRCAGSGSKIGLACDACAREALW